LNQILMWEGSDSLVAPFCAVVRSEICCKFIACFSGAAMINAWNDEELRRGRRLVLGSAIISRFRDSYRIGMVVFGARRGGRAETGARRAPARPERAEVPFARVRRKGGASRTRPRREEEGRTVASRVQVVMDRGVVLPGKLTIFVRHFCSTYAHAV